VGCRSLLAVFLIFGLSVGTLAQGSRYGLGSTPSANELSALSESVSPDGTGLPKGSGTAIQGAAVYAQRGCTRCHGPSQVEGPARPLVGGKVTSSTSYYPIEFWPFAPKIWDYINRAMPFDRPGFLSPDEVYALTAFLLYRNGVIQETDVMDASSLPKVQMPHRAQYAVPSANWQPGKPRPFVAPATP
jgi:S-disulfanyl-L-cysteine oxidoreductase SoxD